MAQKQRFEHRDISVQCLLERPFWYDVILRPSIILTFGFRDIHALSVILKVYDFSFYFQPNPRPVKKRYRLYSPTALTTAYKMVKERGMPVLTASRLHGVPENTLRDRVLGKIDPETCSMGKQPLFDLLEESKIVNHFKRMADLGYGYTQQECVDVATEYAIQLGKRSRDKPLSMRWMEGFLTRWPEMRVVKPRPLEHVRAKMASESIVMSYFDDLEKCINQNGLSDKPHLIYNVDEKGVTVEHKPPYIVASTEYPAQAVTSGKGKTVTILGAGSASGSAIPPYFVFPGKRMNPDLLRDGSPGVNGTVSESGWSNSEVFRKYLAEHFLRFVPGRQGSKVLLLLDGHRSHVALTLADWAVQNNVILFILPAHTSHILQPLDVGCYGPFQRIYHILSHKLMRQTYAAITKDNICQIACKAYTKSLSSENLQSAFRRTGIFPLDREAIPKKSMVPAEVFINETEDDEQDQHNSQSSEATVEGGVPEDVRDLFEEREKDLVRVKNENKKKPRNTVSKLVAGKELTSESVRKAVKEHEHKQKTTPANAVKSLKGKQPSKSPKSLKEKQSKKAPKSPKPGPSHINLLHDSSEDSEMEIDTDVCCVCNRFQPKEQAECISLTFVKWGQCDGIVNGKPCLHWTHLKYCTPVRVLRRGDKFLCPHCKTNEE